MQFYLAVLAVAVAEMKNVSLSFSSRVLGHGDFPYYLPPVYWQHPRPSEHPQSAMESQKLTSVVGQTRGERSLASRSPLGAGEASTAAEKATTVQRVKVFILTGLGDFAFDSKDVD